MKPEQRDLAVRNGLENHAGKGGGEGGGEGVVVEGSYTKSN